MADPREVKILLRLDYGDTIGITELPRVGDTIQAKDPTTGTKERYAVERVIWDYYEGWTPWPTVYVYANRRPGL